MWDGSRHDRAGLGVLPRNSGWGCASLMAFRMPTRSSVPARSLRTISFRQKANSLAGSSDRRCWYRRRAGGLVGASLATPALSRSSTRSRRISSWNCRRRSQATNSRARVASRCAPDSDYHGGDGACRPEDPQDERGPVEAVFDDVHVRDCSTASWWRNARISAQLSRSFRGSSRSSANAFVTRRYASRRSTTPHHRAVIGANGNGGCGGD